MIDLDGTDNKSRIGANAILGVSMAVAKAAAQSAELPLYQYLGGPNSVRIPVPCMNILNGGEHSDNSVDFQEFMLVPKGAPNFTEGLRYVAETFHALKGILKSRKLATSVGYEGGFAPDASSNEAAIELIIEAVKMCQEAGWRYFLSHRSGETEDTFLADFAVAMGGGHLKTGSASRGERIAKYNRLLEIEHELGDQAKYHW